MGAVLLTGARRAFAENVGGAADRLGVSVLALGVLLAGAEPEEAVTAMLASRQGHPALAAGDAVGANLVILTLTLGLAALVTRLPVGRRAVEYGVGRGRPRCGLGAAAAQRGARPARGTALVLLYAGGVVWVWRRERQPPLIGELAELDESDDDEGGSARALPLLLLGVLGMVLGGALAVRGAEGLVDVLQGRRVRRRPDGPGAGHQRRDGGARVGRPAPGPDRAGGRRDGRRGRLQRHRHPRAGGPGRAAGPGTAQRHRTVAVLTSVLPLVLLAGRRSGYLPRPVGALLLVGYVATVGFLFAR